MILSELHCYFRESMKNQINSSRETSSARKPSSARSTRGDELVSSSRSAAPGTDRSGPLDSCRSTMSTGRVHTGSAMLMTSIHQNFLIRILSFIALAALNAEREALKSKLAFIDAALEAENKKKPSVRK